MSSVHPQTVERHALFSLIETTIDSSDAFVVIGPSYPEIANVTTALVTTHKLPGNILSCDPDELAYAQEKFTALANMVGNGNALRCIQGLPFGSARQPASVFVFQFAKLLRISSTWKHIFCIENISEITVRPEPFHRIETKEFLLPNASSSTGEPENGLFVCIQHPGDEDDILEGILESGCLLKMVYLASHSTPPGILEKIDQRLNSAGLFRLPLWKDSLYIHRNLLAHPLVDHLVAILQTNRSICELALKYKNDVIHTTRKVKNLSDKLAKNEKPTSLGREVRKWYFYTNEHKIISDFPLIQSAVMSCFKNTNLKPHCIYSGGKNAATAWLEKRGVVVITHKPIFQKQLEDFSSDQHDRFINRWLCCDIPIIEHDDAYVLVTDIDIIFLQHPIFTDIFPQYLAAVPEENSGQFNSGVMLLNVSNMAVTHPFFIASIVEHIREQSFHQLSPQLEYNAYYGSTYDTLSKSLNTLPGHSEHGDVSIVHFRGVRPETIRRVLSNKTDSDTADHLTRIGQDPTSYAKALLLHDRYRRMATAMSKH
ncbi:hypothetical protein [Desulfovibrio inopinatus]|uniref:hypothetical protein n=1 Tax=Desulfovibrio inopinatus TaxID=102109 RepID=UPI0004854EF2|nr:hypothetical protein [Desulfovibrio inopinatus]